MINGVLIFDIEYTYNENELVDAILFYSNGS